MPALELFGKRTVVAGDDLGMFCLVSVLWRLLQIGLLLSWLVFLLRIQHDQLRGHSHAKEINIIYFCVAYFTTSSTMVTEIVVWRTSMRGTPTDNTERNQKLRFWCFWRILPLGLMRIVSFVLSIVVITTLEEFCQLLQRLPAENGADVTEELSDLRNLGCPGYDGMVIVLYVLVVTHVVDSVVCLIQCLYFLIPQLPLNTRFMYRLFAPVARWETCFRFCCVLLSLCTCCILGGRQALMSDLTDAAVALRDLLDDGGHLDVTFSDVLAALVLIYRQQRQERERKRTLLRRRREGHQEAPKSSQQLSTDEEAPQSASSTRPSLTMMQNRVSVHSLVLKSATEEQAGPAEITFEAKERPVLSARQELDFKIMTEAARFAPYAGAIYGPVMHIKRNPKFGCCSLTASALSCQRSFGRPNIRNDTLLGCNQITLLTTRLTANDILYANFSNSDGRLPYCILSDREMKRIIVSIRGTFSLEDVVTDLSLSSVSMERLGEKYGFDHKDGFAHRGMSESAEWIYDDMLEHGLLERAMMSEEFHGYQLNIVGHSLGAGVASILSVMMRPKYPNLLVYAYEPPGCVLSESLALPEWIFSFVLGDDIIPRMKFESFERLRDRILDTIARINCPKRRIFRHRFMDTFASEDERTASRRASTFLDDGPLPETKYTSQLELFRQHKDKSKRSPELFPPGRLIHLKRTENLTTSTKDVNVAELGFAAPFVPVWSDPEDFDEIQISARLILDHDMNGVSDALQLLAKKMKRR